MKTFNLSFFIAVLTVVILSFVSWTGKEEYIMPQPLATIEGTEENHLSAANPATTTNFSFTVNANGTLYWYEDSE